MLAALGLSSSALAQDDPFADEGPVEDQAESDVDDGSDLDEPEPEEPVSEGPSGSAGVSLSGSASTAEGVEGDAAASGLADEGGTEAMDEDVEEIVVTGSRIKRTTYSLPSSVQVVSRKELEMSGATNMSDVVKHMSANSGSSFNPDVSTAAGGTAQFNLRGLGISSTLVLLNGRRLTESATVGQDGNSFVDINSIPLNMVERIEVLKGGASAIYGSEAVAGVVNIITRRDIDGFEVQLGGQTTDDFDQDEWDVTLLGGATGERTRVNGMLTYFDRSPLGASDRDYTADGSNISALGQPGLYVVPASPLLFYRESTCASAPNSIAAPAAGVQTALPNGETLWSALDADGNPTLPPYCRFNFNPFFDLVPKEQRLNSYVTVDHDITDHTRTFFEAGYARARTVRGVSPAFPILQNLIIPADHQYNPVGQPLIWRGRPLGAEAGRQEQYYESDTVHTVAGIGGDFGGITSGNVVEDWEWEIAGSYSANRFRGGLPDSLTKPLQDALNSCGPGDPPEDCFNPFYMQGAPNSQAIVDAITGERETVTDAELTTAGVSLAGPLFELPGGDFAFAIGAQMRHQQADSQADHDANQGNYVFLIGGDDFAAERDILGAYGELVMPFFDGFELQAAGRMEDYDDVGSTFDPKIGLSWTPAQTFMGDEADPASKVRVRGTYATSFKAPSLLQVHGSGTALEGLLPVTPDPMTGAPVTGSTATYLAVNTFGNADLVPEKSTAITAGLEYMPVEGLLMELDYFTYDYEDIIITEEAQAKIGSDFACGVPEDVRPTTCDEDITRDATGAAQQIQTEYINANSLKTDGIDFNIGYRSDFGAEAGTFSFAGTGTYVLSFNVPEAQVGTAYAARPNADCSGGECNIAGFRNKGNFARSMPTLRVNFPIGWSLDGHDVGVVTHVIGSYIDDANPAPDGTMPDIDAFLTFDLQYSLRIDEGDNLATTVKVGVQNLLDSDPPPVADDFGYDVLTHDPRGRLLYARLIQEF